MTPSVREKLLQAKLAAKMESEASKNEKSKESSFEVDKIETEKEECPYCHNFYKNVERHVPRCPRNENAVKSSSSKKEMEDINNEISLLKDENEKLSRLIEDLTEKIKPKISTSNLYGELMEFCKNSNNPLYQSIYRNSEDKKRHWRTIVLYTIGALEKMGVI